MSRIATLSEVGSYLTHHSPALRLDCVTGTSAVLPTGGEFPAFIDKDAPLAMAQAAPAPMVVRTPAPVAVVATAPAADAATE